MMTNENRGLRRLAVGAAVALLLPVGACQSTRDQLLQVNLPDQIKPDVVTTPEAADALRIGALSRVRIMTAGGESLWLLGGLLTDEWKSSDTVSQRNGTDQRAVQESNGNIQGAIRSVLQVRTSAREAIDALKVYKPTPQWGLGQMYFALALAEMQIAENLCNGVPLTDGTKSPIEYGMPLSNVEIYTLAKAHLDTALANALPVGDANATTLKTSATILQARVLVDQGQQAAAATLITAAAIPTSFANTVNTYSLTSGDNQIWSLQTSAKRWTIGDSVDSQGRVPNAIPFASGGDPRIRLQGTSLGTSPLGKGFDVATNLVSQFIWGRSDPVNIVSGLDARLIEAEGKLAANDIPGMMTIPNALRATPPQLGMVTTAGFSPQGAFVPAAMAALPTPATQAAAVALFFREKAYWTFGRGQRLGDMRRMIRQYNYTQDNVFPTGNFFKGGVYGTDVNLPMTTDEYNNPNFKGCTDRKA